MSLGAPVSAAGALYQGQMQQSALDQQAQVQQANAQLDLEKGNADAGRQEIMSGQKIGAIQGAAAAGGVTQSGSVLSVIGASAQNAEMDRLNILHGAEVRSINAENQASLDQLGASSAMKGAWMSAFGSLLQGSASTFANQNGANTQTGDGASAADLQGDYGSVDSAGFGEGGAAATSEGLSIEDAAAIV